ncbi:hypothetical protein DASC09_063070 [Saccharomycopsis crataegensis]|uniref:Uncharacterized protein n=1 Tax=Saccharomycopsis crataegensis TaxID=43959 RepID=A0AAV5QY02_9ASCO|nr:hypothetical protein DASC09_063070 [Saccharomycopsis crataegensis]
MMNHHLTTVTTAPLRPSNFVTLSQIGVEHATGNVVGATVGPQTIQAISNIQQQLRGRGIGLENVVSVLVFVSSPNDVPSAEQVLQRRLGPRVARRFQVVQFPGKVKVELRVVAKGCHGSAL